MGKKQAIIHRLILEYPLLEYRDWQDTKKLAPPVSVFETKVNKQNFTNISGMILVDFRP